MLFYCLKYAMFSLSLTVLLYFLMNLIIRQAQVKDLPEIMQIYNAEIEHGIATWNNQPKVLTEYEHWFQQLQQLRFPIFVAEDPSGQKIAGYADYADFRPFHGYKDTVEHSVYIHPHYFRRGLAQQLMMQLIEHAKTHNKHIMVAGIDSENLASIQLHKKLGFKQTGYMPEVGQKFGKWRDLVLMQLQLNES